MLIKENSNVVTLRLIRLYVDDRIKKLEDNWQKTYDDEKQFTEHCVTIGRLREIEDFSAWLKSTIEEINEDF